jgi:hypothetical protein
VKINEHNFRSSADMKQLTGASVLFLVAMTVKIFGRTEINKHLNMQVTYKELYCRLDVCDTLCL